ncbi:Kynurenine formamidase [Sporobacter termitidis DSM 10068]|uniref:Kynurenine formamidase n=1 Tax=Sporobacter termitidis DSM 10068 TaxID=1123282 RepID=A0A1M5XWV8_9FIRM|nr:cyclase family protein [Sporobacter termitidis]SHI04018.1 Kynurenine formamidase [Sporobacter termitidis DSM 10068]
MIHDLTITLDENTLPFPDSGDPRMRWQHLVDHTAYKCQVSLFSLVTHLGTHADAPLHFVKNGKTTAAIDLGRYSGQAVCLEVPDIPTDKHLDISDVLEKNSAFIRPGDIIILSTGWEDKVGTPEYFNFPEFDPGVGAVLEHYEAHGIGFDLPSIDRKGDAHQSVLTRDMGIIESLINLKPLIGKRFYFSAVPLKFSDGDGSPVRAYAVTD